MDGEDSTPTTSSPSEDDEMKIIDHKGGKAVLYKNHHYHKLRDYKNGQTILRCSSYRKTKCKGTITVKAKRILKSMEHSCPKNDNHIMVMLEKDKLKKAAICSDRPIPQLYEEAILQMKHDGQKKEIIDSIPLSSIKHGLYDARYKSVGTTKSIFNNMHEVDVPKKYLKFLLADFHDDQTRILVFCSPGNKEQLKNVTEFFVDGTFSSCPDPFKQLFTIHGDMGRSSESIHVKPFVFALMSDKKQRSYRYLFCILKSQLPELNIEKVHCDFEIGMINAIKEVWPTVIIKGCYYHWSQMIWRNAKKMGCQKTKHEKRIVRLCSVLPLIGEEKIMEGWNYIKSEYENTKLAMQPFMRYVDNTLKKKDFIKIISTLGERHRTNNVLEGWHSKLNKSINKNTKTLLRLLKILADFDVLAVDKTANRRRKKYIHNDDIIIYIQMQLINSEISIGHALEKLR